MSENKITFNFGCLTTLFFIFLILKLCNIITWSWWWIFAPIWIPIVIAIILTIIMIIFMYKKIWR